MRMMRHTYRALENLSKWKILDQIREYPKRSSLSRAAIIKYVIRVMARWNVQCVCVHWNTESMF